MNKFQWYRRWRGGKWYRAICGLRNPIAIEWTHYPIVGEVILEAEDYNVPKSL